MPRLLRLTARAQRDLLEIRAYLRREAGEASAARATARIVQRMEALIDFPEAAQINTALEGMPRSAPVNPWVIVYNYDHALDRILVWRIVHGGRDLASLIRKPRR